jgi:DNA-binding Xre family transcriptional regulator
MSAHTSVQIIEQDGVPAFAVIPYEEYLKLVPPKDDEYIPHEVVGLIVKKGYNTAKAWRIHLGLTQKEVAEKAGITQSALSQMESSDNEMRTATLEKIAAALGVSPGQLED